jgi:hypothetical protein
MINTFITKSSQISALILIGSTFLAISNARAQLNPDGVDDMILYKFDGPQGVLRQ